MKEIKTRIRLSDSKKHYEVIYSYDNWKSYQLHKKNLTLDQANKESISIKGFVKLLADLKSF